MIHRSASLLFRAALPCLLVAISTVAQLPEGPRKHAQTAPLRGELRIDGHLNEDAWAGAPEHTGFEKVGLKHRTEVAADVQTQFRVLYDDNAFYVGIRCLEPHTDQLTVRAADKHDAAMWSDDDVELFVDPVGDRTEYYQFAINSKGTQVDMYLIERGNTQKAYSAVWQAETVVGDGFWNVEIRLPFGALYHRPSATWAENWVFSISRTRTPKPRYYSQFSPGNKYHDIDSFGTVGPIPVDKSRFNLFAELPSFRLTPDGEGFRAAVPVKLENRGTKRFDGTLTLTVLEAQPVSVSTAIALPPETTTPIPPLSLPLLKEDKYPVLIEVADRQGKPILGARSDEWFRYEPLSVRLHEPNYRNCIYPSQDISVIRGVLSAAIAVDGDNISARVTLAGPNAAPRIADIPRASAETLFEIDVDHLPVGDYVLRGEILQGKGKAQRVLADIEKPFRKLPQSTVEARVDGEGNLLIDGTPVFIRGWYGSMSYVRSTAAWPETRLPRATNFIMGCSRDTTMETGLYTLRGFTRTIDEAKAKLDNPIDGELKAKLRAGVAAVRSNRNIIGYYISDEPECRGLSPTFLESMYAYLKELDPYRFCMIVSRAPERYMKACDVMCPHPYMNPQQYENGTRKFAGYMQHIRNVTREAQDANDGSKAVWCMPQTFSYGGNTDRHPNFRESRWFTFTALANGAKGIVPFIFNGYWNHLENRIAMDAVFEELALLAPAWKAPGTATEITGSMPQVDAIAKRFRKEPGRPTHLFIVAVNQSYEGCRTTLTCPALNELKTSRLIALRENRTVDVEGGAFTDDFGRLGVHVYTTLEALPYMDALTDIQAEIDRRLRAARTAGNLLADPRLNWTLMGRKGLFDGRNQSLTDGVLDAGGWLPVYGDRSQCQIVFTAPVTFGRLVLHTPSIRDAELQVRKAGTWHTVHAWRDQFVHRLEWAGPAVTTDAFRILPKAFRGNWNGRAMAEITELEIYRK
ncbi:MAG: hypothetical protein HN742_13770 [Lentisphaerae bacterium]|nr:hypothetical protein [Lentisphaerota bacterium]MBT5606164.1 hypothetical protein [Lentisphaerota bacterium]MBT7056383.1 hypothetical protein [Lentisphaerota bacterium]MBT7842941.1 hypothetical protein [Lentisphaerota bacterium]